MHPLPSICIGKIYLWYSDCTIAMLTQPDSCLDPWSHRCVGQLHLTDSLGTWPQYEAVTTALRRRLAGTGVASWT
jgi:hypothetical protein